MIMIKLTVGEVSVLRGLTYLTEELPLYKLKYLLRHCLGVQLQWASSSTN